MGKRLIIFEDTFGMCSIYGMYKNYEYTKLGFENDIVIIIRG